MAMGHMDISELKKLRDKLKRNCDAQQLEEFFTSCSKSIAENLLKDVVKRTPIGKYDGVGVAGGTLADSWFVGGVEKNGTTYTVNVENNALSDDGKPYAIYVEFGHRTRSGGWVEGKKMLTITEEEIKEVAPNILDRKVADFLRRCMR